MDMIVYAAILTKFRKQSMPKHHMLWRWWYTRDQRFLQRAQYIRLIKELWSGIIWNMSPEPLLKLNTFNKQVELTTTNLSALASRTTAKMPLMRSYPNKFSSHASRQEKFTSKTTHKHQRNQRFLLSALPPNKISSHDSRFEIVFLFSFLFCSTA